MTYRCCHCGTAFPDDHPLCPQCGAAAVVAASRWDGLTGQQKTDVAQLQATAMKYHSGLESVLKCRNLTTAFAAAKRALS